MSEPLQLLVVNIFNKKSYIEPHQPIQISVVIPTCNRRDRLFSLLQNIRCLSFIPAEVIIVDSGEEQMKPEQLNNFSTLNIRYIFSEKSVCIQRNIGIKQAVSPWIFLCDDDIEIRKDYLDVLADYIQRHPEAGAVSGVWLQKENDEWLASYPITSARELAWKYVFRLGIWGEIKCNSRNFFITRIKRSYEQKGNHISGAGWPVNTKFDGDSLQCPVYSLGAALVKREWLLQSPYDEALDRYGIGDNYGVIAGFYKPVVHIVNKAVIFHHREPANRLKRSLQYYRRTLALDYFIKTKPALSYANRYRLVWSLFGNLLMFIYKREGAMMKMSVKSIVQIAFNNNPYMKAARESKKVIEPV